MPGKNFHSATDALFDRQRANRLFLRDEDLGLKGCAKRSIPPAG